MKNNIVINENHKNDVFASDKSQFHIRIRYPQVLYDGEKDKTNMLLFKKMNEYYSGVADAMYEKAKKCFNEKSKIKKDNFYIFLFYFLPHFELSNRNLTTLLTTP